MRGYLAEPRTFLVKEGSHAVVTGRRTLGDDLVETETLPIVAGEILLHAREDGRLVLASATLSLGEIELSPSSIPPQGLKLRDVALSLRNEMPPEVTWTPDGSSASATGTVSLLLDWSFLGHDGKVYPLAPQRIEAVPIELTVARQDGRVVVSLHGDRTGVFLKWAGYLEFSDLVLEVQAVE